MWLSCLPIARLDVGLQWAVICWTIQQKPCSRGRRLICILVMLSSESSVVWICLRQTFVRQPSDVWFCPSMSLPVGQIAAFGTTKEGWGDEKLVVVIKTCFWCAVPCYRIRNYLLSKHAYFRQATAATACENAWLIQAFHQTWSLRYESNFAGGNSSFARNASLLCAALSCFVMFLLFGNAWTVLFGFASID